MSHFTVTVCILDDEKLTEKGIEQCVDDALSPYYEGRDDIEPYKSFEDGTPEEFWWVESVRRDAAEHHAGIADEKWVRRVAEDNLSLNERYGRNRREPTEAELRAAEEQCRASNAEAAEWAARIGEDPTWRTVVELYNEKYHPGNQLAVNGSVEPDEIDEGRMHYDEETGRAYTWSTSNAQGKWDWYVIGGRWQRRIIAAKDADRNLLVFGRSGSGGDNDEPREINGQICCDGGPRTMLDFDAMRDREAAKAAERYDRYLAFAKDHPPAKTWKHFQDLAEAGAINWDEARNQYYGQPLVTAHNALGHENWITWEPIVDEFEPDRDTYIQNARDTAVPGYALLDLDGNWIEPGRMGWFGVSHAEDADRVLYNAKASEYLDNLPANAWVVLVDCHT